MWFFFQKRQKRAILAFRSFFFLSLFSRLLSFLFYFLFFGNTRLMEERDTSFIIYHSHQHGLWLAISLFPHAIW